MNYHLCRVSRKLLTSGFISIRIRPSLNTHMYTQIKKNFQEVGDDTIDILILFSTLSQPSLCDIDPGSSRDVLQDAETTELGRREGHVLGRHPSCAGVDTLPLFSKRMLGRHTRTLSSQMGRNFFGGPAFRQFLTPPSVAGTEHLAE